MPVVGRHMLSEEVDLPLHTDALACVPKRCKSLKINSIDGIRAPPYRPRCGLGLVCRPLGGLKSRD